MKLEKRKRGAEVAFPDGSRAGGRFFLSTRSANRSGDERVYDLLNGERAFLPFEREGGGIILLQKGCIVMIRLEENESDARLLPYPKEKTARVELLSGEIVEGKVYLDLPESRFRLSDFLNSCGGFFYLEVEGKDHLINCRYVKTAVDCLSG